MNSPRLSAWLADQRKKKDAAQLIETSLLTGRMAGYYFFRFRFFALKSCLTLLIAALQLKILAVGFGETNFLLKAIGAGAAVTLLTAFWWAGLETMRGEIRKQKRSENGGILIPQVLLLWKRITQNTLIASTIIGTASLLLWVFLSQTGLSPFNFYLLALLLKLLLDIPLRAFHSAVYATRRIYKPLHWILGIESLGFVAFLWLTPLIGAWAVGISALLTTTLNFCVSWRFINKMYRHMGYAKAVQTLARKHKKPYPAPPLKTFLSDAIPLTLFRIDGLLLLAITLAPTQADHLSTQTLFLLALAVPMLHITQEWAQLLYFDYKRLELDYLKYLRERFESGGRLMPFILSLTLWCLLPPALWGINENPPQIPPWEILLLFVTSAYLAHSTIKTFSLGNKKNLLLFGSLLALGLGALPFLAPSFTLLTLGASALLLATHLALLKVFRARDVETLPTSLLPIGTWLHLLKHRKQGFIQGGWLKISEGDISLYHVKTSLSKGTRNLLRDQTPPLAPTFFASLQPNTLIYFSRSNSPLLPHYIRCAAGPHLQDIFHYSGTPENLLQALAPLEPALEAAFQPTPLWEHPHSLPLCFPLNSRLKNPPPITPSDAQEILHNAKETLLKGNPPDKWDRWDVTTEDENGHLIKIHAFPLSSPQRLRQEWRNLCLKKTIHSAWNPTEPSPRESTPPPTPQPLPISPSPKAHSQTTRPPSPNPHKTQAPSAKTRKPWKN